MAKAITNIEKYIMDKEEEKQQSIHQILDVISDNRESITTFLDILNEIHELGILDIIQGVLKNRQEISVIALSQFDQPSIHHMMKTGMNAIQFLGKLEPDKLQDLLQGVERGIERLTETQNNQTHSLWEIGKAMRDPNVTFALSSMIRFMNGMGEAMKETEKRIH